MGAPLTFAHGLGQLRADTDPESIAPAVDGALRSADRLIRLQFDQPLPEAVLSAAAEVLENFPEVALRAYGREVDPSLAWRSGFEHIQHLQVDLWHATSFEPSARSHACARSTRAGTRAMGPWTPSGRGALRNVNGLSMLARGPSETLRFLILERLTKPDTAIEATSGWKSFAHRGSRADGLHAEVKVRWRAPVASVLE